MERHSPRGMKELELRVRTGSDLGNAVLSQNGAPWDASESTKPSLWLESPEAEPARRHLSSLGLRERHTLGGSQTPGCYPSQLRGLDARVTEPADSVSAETHFLPQTPPPRTTPP